MAPKKGSTRAESQVTDTKKKASQSSGKSRNSAKKTKKQPAVRTEYQNMIPAEFIVAFFSLCLFVLFVFLSFNSEGALLKVTKSVVLGLIGQAGFYISIPALLYLTIINTFGRKMAVQMRSVCTVVFVFLCGAIFHLFVQKYDLSSGLKLFADLYMGGATGTTGGVLCGSIAYLLRWACGKSFSLLILVVGAVLTLLGAMQITIPSIVRAIANRPRDDWEEDDYIEPAAIVVNHIANKQIAHKRQRREQAAMAQASMAERRAAAAEPKHTEQNPLPPKHHESPVTAHPEVESEPQETVKQVPGKGASFMDRIDREISAPLAGTSEYVRESVPNVFDEPVAVPSPADDAKELEPEIPLRMPELKREEPLPSPPKMEQPARPAPVPETKTGKVSAKDAAASAQEVAQEIAQAQTVPKTEYCFPPIDLLKRPMRGSGDGTEEMRENSRRLNETLASFRIDAHIINVTRGPSVTRYEVELDKGVRLNKLTGCADDIALSLGASGVRIAAVPGKISVVGIEVPNRVVTTVSLREVIDSAEFARSKSKSSFAVGKDIGGNCIIGNIAKMPHLLIAGTTGSGKSVCMNSIIISLLYKASPDDVKLIMVDPKMVELGIYNGIPHLLIPVVTDPKKAAGSLQWAVTEMLRR